MQSPILMSTKTQDAPTILRKGEEPMKIAFASCMDAYRVPQQPVWDEINRRQPDVLLLLGDQIYMDWGDLGESNWKKAWDKDATKTLANFAEEMHARYKRQWEVDSFRTLIADMVARKGSASVQLTWDDHDFAWNNRDGCRSPRRTFPNKKCFETIVSAIFSPLNQPHSSAKLSCF
jgi:phosphodiesterase/alkaline phosphatase D-like protein